MKNLKKVIKIKSFINSATITGIIAILSGALTVQDQFWSGINKPTFYGQQAIIIGWALIVTGVWFCYWGIKQGIKKNSNVS